jgi:hypothetical protein
MNFTGVFGVIYIYILNNDLTADLIKNFYHLCLITTKKKT